MKKLIFGIILAAGLSVAAPMAANAIESTPTPTPTPSCGYADNCAPETPKDAVLVVHVQPPVCGIQGTALFDLTQFATYTDPDYGNTDGQTGTFTRHAVADAGHLFADGSSSSSITYTVLPAIPNQSTNPNGECYVAPITTPSTPSPTPEHGSNTPPSEANSTVPPASGAVTPTTPTTELAHTGKNENYVEWGSIGAGFLIIGGFAYFMGRRRNARKQN